MPFLSISKIVLVRVSITVGFRVVSMFVHQFQYPSRRLYGRMSRIVVSVIFSTSVWSHRFTFDFACFVYRRACRYLGRTSCICVHIAVLRRSSCVVCCMRTAGSNRNSISLHAICIVCVHAAMTVRLFLHARFHCRMSAVRSLAHAHCSLCVASSLPICLPLLLRSLHVSLSCGLLACMFF